MRWVTLGLVMLLGKTAFAADPGPALPGDGPDPAPARAPDVVAPTGPILPSIAIPTFVLVRPDQPQYGPTIPPSPAHSVAMLEAGGPTLGDDPRVRSAAFLLEQLTASYVEDAPRISELTIRMVREIRARDQAASPFEMMVGATHWKRSPSLRGNIPRKFQEFTRLYRSIRIEQGKDHSTALSLMQRPHPSVAPLP